jgi:hypothetical protein
VVLGLEHLAVRFEAKRPARLRPRTWRQGVADGRSSRCHHPAGLLRQVQAIEVDGAIQWGLGAVVGQRAMGGWGGDGGGE